MNHSVKKIEWPIALEDNREYICCRVCYYPIAPLLPETIEHFYYPSTYSTVNKNKVLIGFTVEVQNLFTKDFDDSIAVEYWQKQVGCYNCSYNLSDPFENYYAEMNMKDVLLSKYQKNSVSDRNSKSLFFLYAKKLLKFKNTIEMKKHFDDNEKFKKHLKRLDKLVE